MPSHTQDELVAENEELRRRLEESEATIEAIKQGEVDAVVVYGPKAETVYTFEGADHPYRRLIESVRQGAATLNARGNILYCNQCLVDLLRQSPGSLVGSCLPDFMDEVDHPVWERLLRETVLTGHQEGEVRLQRPDGTVFPARLVLELFPLPDTLALSAIITDLTQQKHYEELAETRSRLAQNHERLQMALEAARMVAWDSDLEHNRIVLSDNASQVLGLACANSMLNAEGLFRLIHPDDAARYQSVVNEAIAHRSEYRCQFRLVRPDNGAVLWLESRGRVFCNREGTPGWLGGVMMDVSERKQAEEALKEADCRKDEFLATLAHELRNPLAPLCTALHTIQLSPEPQAKEQARAIMERQLAHLVRLVDDLLDVSRITKGKIKLQRESLNVAAVVASAVETSRPLIEASKHELTLSLPQQPLYVVGDLTRLAQVIANLLNNSAKYTPEGGHIWLTVERQHSDVLISVRDTGIGIAANQLPRIFEMFTQTDRALEWSQSGLGIGLTLVRRFVEMHGGTIEAYSDGVGKGSEFLVRLPLCVEPPDRHPPEAPQGDGKEITTPARHILVVDDNKDGADSLGLLLRSTGHEVELAYDGPSALETARVFRPDVVLLDIGLPGMSGYNVARQMRQMPELQGVVLVAQTGWGQEEDHRRSKEAGFHAHLTKPVEFDALQRLLASFQRT